MVRQRRYFLSETLVRQAVGLRLTDGGVWQVYFGPALLADLDEAEGVLRPLGVVASSPERPIGRCYLCGRSKVLPMCQAVQIDSFCYRNAPGFPAGCGHGC